MGQNFQLVAPRAKLSLSWGGKLGEMLFDGSARALVHLLAVPVRPPNPYIHNTPATPSQTQSDWTTSTELVRESLADKHTKRKPEGNVLVDSPQHKRAKAQGNNNISETGQPIEFSTLPVEIHRLIFSHLELVEDVVCLGVTSRYFWAVSQEHIHDFYTSFLGHWAGENIVCVGEDVESNDLPPGLFSAEERDELGRKTIDIPYDDDYPDEIAFPAVPFTLHHFTHPSISYMEKEVDLRSVSSRIYFHCRDRGSYKDPAFSSRLSEPLVIEESHYFPQDEQWILRNLTTKEYIRGEAVALKPEYIHGPDIDILGFGDIIMSRICWSTSPSASMNYEGGITRGTWAGHCFDITTFARHSDETKGVSWKDVSEEVMREIACIWESEYGSDWREKICNI